MMESRKLRLIDPKTGAKKWYLPISPEIFFFAPLLFPFITRRLWGWLVAFIVYDLLWLVMSVDTDTSDNVTRAFDNLLRFSSLCLIPWPTFFGNKWATRKLLKDDWVVSSETTDDAWKYFQTAWKLPGEPKSVAQVTPTPGSVAATSPAPPITPVIAPVLATLPNSPASPANPAPVEKKPLSKVWLYLRIAAAVIVAGIVVLRLVVRSSSDLELELTRTNGTEIKIANIGTKPIKITKIAINDRDDCEVATFVMAAPVAFQPKELKVGDSTFIFSSCDVIRVSLKTDRGSGTYSFTRK